MVADSQAPWKRLFSQYRYVCRRAVRNGLTDDLSFRVGHGNSQSRLTLSLHCLSGGPIYHGKFLLSLQRTKSLLILFGCSTYIYCRSCVAETADLASPRLPLTTPSSKHCSSPEQIFRGALEAVLRSGAPLYGVSQRLNVPWLVPFSNRNIDSHALRMHQCALQYLVPSSTLPTAGMTIPSRFCQQH